MNSFVGYTSPEIIEGLKITFNSVSQTSGTFESYAINYSNGSVKLALATDSNALGYDNKRVSTTFPIKLLEIDIGVLYQSTKKLSTGASESGHVISLEKRVSNKGSLYMQTSNSNIKLESGKQNSFGYTHKISDISNIFIHLSNRENRNKDKNVDYVSVGFEYKF